MMRASILSIIVLLFSTQLQAASKIKGAFGVKLGQKLHGGLQPIITGSIVSGKYRITPPKTLEDFSNYMVDVVPTTKKIYRISADHVLPTNVLCEKKGFELVSILNRKYGQLERRVDKPFHYYKYKGNKRLDVFCLLSSEAGKPILRVQMRDAKLHSTATVEIRRYEQKDTLEAL
jgi:hypothetical protein